MDNSKRYYVYEWYIVDTNEIFYVGKGCGSRYKTRKRENIYFTNMLNTHNCDVRKVYENLSEDEAFEKEIFLIKHYRENTCFRLTNILDGGNNPPTLTGDKSPTKRKEVRAKISKANKKNWKCEEYRKSVKKSMRDFYKTEKGFNLASARGKANWQNEETRNKIIDGVKSTMQSDSFKAKHSKIMTEAYSSQEARNKVTGASNGASRRIKQYTLDGLFVGEYETLKEAYKVTGMDYKNISKALRGHRKTAYGFVWKYADEKVIEYTKRKPYDNNIQRDRRAIIQYDKQHNKIAEYESVAEATKENGFSSHSNIICCLKGRTKSAYGYLWEYK